jgi:hypothetical protein
VLAAAHIRCAVGEQDQIDPLRRLPTAPPWRMTSPGCSHGSDYARSLRPTSHPPHRGPAEGSARRGMVSDGGSELPPTFVPAITGALVLGAG